MRCVRSLAIQVVSLRYTYRVVRIQLSRVEYCDPLAQLVSVRAQPARYKAIQIPWHVGPREEKDLYFYE